MKKYHTLFISDLRHAGLDPVLMVGIFAPLALLVVSRFGFPMIADWLRNGYAFDLYEYSSFAAIFLVVTIPILIGMMTGLLMLDERDENVISYYAVTPLMRRGYMVYRLVLPSVLCTLLSSLYLIVSGLFSIQLEHIYILLLLAIEAPCFALFLASFAANKVEGLALSKIGGLFIAGPIVAYFVPSPWQIMGAWIPTYWPAKLFFVIEATRGFSVIPSFLVGLIFHLSLLSIMVRIFIRRAD
ncbi:Fluoroquinolones export permease protein/MT2760 [compost metagenome]